MEMRTELKRLHQMLGTTIVYVTHDQIEAMTLATRIAVMRNGKIEQLGTPEEVYDHPATLYVAGFVGSPPMNVLDGVATGEGVQLDGSGAVITLPARLKNAAAAGRRVKLGVRPEALRLASDTAEIPVLEVEIEVVELTGPELVVTGRVSGQRVTACLPPRTKLTVGMKQAFGFDDDALHLFDAQTELALG
jgi:multiple sugar transport system ATP-binding protein